MKRNDKIRFMGMTLSLIVMLYGIFSLYFIVPRITSNIASIITTILVMYMVFVYAFVVMKKIKRK